MHRHTHVVGILPPAVRVQHLEQSERISGGFPGRLFPVGRDPAGPMETREVVRVRHRHPAGERRKPRADEQAEQDELEGAEAVAEPDSPAGSERVD